MEWCLTRAWGLAAARHAACRGSSSKFVRVNAMQLFEINSIIYDSTNCSVLVRTTCLCHNSSTPPVNTPYHNICPRLRNAEKWKAYFTQRNISTHQTQVTRAEKATTEQRLPSIESFFSSAKRVTTEHSNKAKHNICRRPCCWLCPRPLSHEVRMPFHN